MRFKISDTALSPKSVILVWRTTRMMIQYTTLATMTSILVVTSAFLRNDWIGVFSTSLLKRSFSSDFTTNPFTHLAIVIPKMKMTRAARNLGKKAKIDVKRLASVKLSDTWRASRVGSDGFILHTLPILAV